MIQPSRARQAWTIAKIELRRAFFAKRSFWVYGLALLPSVIFFGHGLDAKFRIERLTRRGVISPALIDSVRVGESADEVKKRLGKPVQESWSTRSKRVRQKTGNAGTTTHVIDPAVDYPATQYFTGNLASVGANCGVSTGKQIITTPPATYYRCASTATCPGSRPA